MKAVIQRVSSASVEIGDSVVASVGKGLLVLVGADKADTEKDVNWMADRLAKMRIFNDEAGKMNLALADVGGAVLLVSNFTVCGDAAGNRRPSFIDAASYEQGEALFSLLVTKTRELVGNVQTGEFGANMKVSLVNDGPVTIVVESP